VSLGLVIIKLERALFEVMVLLMWAWIWASGSYSDWDPILYMENST